jgi:hypothetical protein
MQLLGGESLILSVRLRVACKAVAYYVIGLPFAAANLVWQKTLLALISAPLLTKLPMGRGTSLKVGRIPPTGSRSHWLNVVLSVGLFPEYESVCSSILQYPHAASAVPSAVSKPNRYGAH